VASGVGVEGEMEGIRVTHGIYTQLPVVGPLDGPFFGRACVGILRGGDTGIGFGGHGTVPVPVSPDGDQFSTV
jgi:hypothetical protein